ncbi:efflux RND transporter periplasmic adaptor subunit [Roseovarius salinarum]|uniref:efflux RND transporter periplasmic adaptor subunit n=1 Tax=Roseovarius salinarum TaxID=1981892 RepID=UPI000C32EFBB|nr:efflux RND transporter periplasmic adaptor subunit [Roseovarius salinarum]
MRGFFVAAAFLVLGVPAGAESLSLSPQSITEWKAVYGQVETRDRVPARARIGGTVVELTVSEGDTVEAGQQIARVEDDKLQFRLDAMDARIEALESRLETARTDLERGRTLLERGVITTQRLDQLETEVNVIEGELRGARSEKLVIEQQVEEGEVASPEAGVVLSVPVSRGSVVTPGEALAEIGGGGVFLRLAVPERHAGDLAEGDTIQITGGSNGDPVRRGELVKLYPLITGGRVQADVEVAGLDGRFVGRRVPVRLPVGTREALLVPEAALTRRGGLDFVRVQTGEATLRRTVVPGRRVMRDGTRWREILTGLKPGETVVWGDE